VNYFVNTPDTLDEYSDSGIVGLSSECESTVGFGLVCIHDSVGCRLLYPGLHLHTPLSFFCTLQTSFGSMHAESNECNEQFSEADMLSKTKTPTKTITKWRR